MMLTFVYATMCCVAILVTFCLILVVLMLYRIEKVIEVFATISDELDGVFRDEPQEVFFSNRKGEL